MHNQKNYSAPDELPPAEHRANRRRPALFPGICVYAGGQHKFDCTLRDLSDRGARILFARCTILPSNLFLIDVRQGLVHEAKVAWFKSSSAGLFFVSTRKLGDITDPAQSYFKRYWLERCPRMEVIG